MMTSLNSLHPAGGSVAPNQAPSAGDRTSQPGVSIVPADGLHGQLGLFEVTVDGHVQYLAQADIDAAGYGANGASGGSSAPPPAGADWKPKRNDDVLFLGMGDGASHELAALRERGVRVTGIQDAPKDDQIKVGRTRYDLSDPAQAKRFAATLGLPPDQTDKIADVISSANPDSRDELAQLTQVWARAEKGGQIPSRLMLSGHSAGGSVWGDHNGVLKFESLEKLAAAMPRAARSVEDIHLSACYSGEQGQLDRFRAMFPNAKTIWAYIGSASGSAPGAFEGATTHERLWEKATRGDKDTLDRGIAARVHKGENVAVWSAGGGYDNGRPQASLADTRADVASRRPAFAQAFSGDAAVTDPQRGPLREYYSHLQRLVQHRDLPAAERATLGAERDQTIRPLFYSANVAPKFAQVHREAIKAGYESLGITPPDFGAISRKDALAAIARFERVLAGTHPPPQAARDLLPLLTEGLRDLSPARIPENWV